MTEFAALFDIYKDAVFQKDIDKFISIFDDNIRVFDMWGKWSHDGLPAWRKMAEDWFGSLGTERVVVTFDDIQIQENGDLATASAFAKFAALSDKGQELRYLKNRLTWVAHKKNGAWKIIHEHTSGPVDHATLKVMLKR